jgi:hypothetical protein
MRLNDQGTCQTVGSQQLEHPIASGPIRMLTFGNPFLSNLSFREGE